MTKTYRKDVKAVFPEAGTDVQAGFKIVVNNAPKGKYKLVITCGDKKSEYCKQNSALKKFNSEENAAYRTVRYLKRYGAMATVKQIGKKLSGKDKAIVDLYPAWRKKHEIKQAELDEQRGIKFDYEPVFSIVIPLYNTRIRFLREMIDSIINQTYGRWELCLAD